MKKAELRERIVALGVAEGDYSLEGGLPCEAYCLGFVATKWEVYYSERGGKSGLVFFDSEEEACDYMYALLIKDNVGRRIR